MKKITEAAVGLIVFFMALNTCFAQEAKIVRLRGEVFTRSREVMPFEKAKKGDILHKDYQVETRENSECVLSFGKDFRKRMSNC